MQEKLENVPFWHENQENCCEDIVEQNSDTIYSYVDVFFIVWTPSFSSWIWIVKPIVLIFHL